LAAWGYSDGCVIAWRKILSLGARLVVLRALRTGIFVLSKKYAASSLTLDVVAGVWVDGWRWLGLVALRTPRRLACAANRYFCAEQKIRGFFAYAGRRGWG